ncbi:MAG: ABC transporter permease [Thermoplasmata archaeon]
MAESGTAAGETAPTPSAPLPPSGRRPNPRIEQYKRTWFFLRRNTLALVGLGIIFLLVGIGIYAAFQPIPWTGLPECSASDNQPISFDEKGLPAGTSWSVSIDGKMLTTTSNNLTFSLATGPSYPFTVGNVTGYTASPASGAINVAGEPQTEKITFTASGGGAVSSGGSASGPAAVVGLPACSVCTYPVGTPVPGPNCYQTPKNVPGVIAPTISISPLTLGALPMGSLALQPDIPYFYNIYPGMLRGTDYSLVISFSIVIVGAMVGLFLGAVSGFFGGVVDETIMRLVDIFLSIPQLLFVIIVIAVVSSQYQTLFGLSDLDTRVFLLITAFMIVWWPYYARIVRGQVLVVREQKYVEAARASGAGKGRIVLRHIVPNSMYPVFIQMSLDVGAIPILIGTLVFLGFTIWPTPYFPEWGTIAAFGTSDIVNQFLLGCQLGICVIPWWQMVFPGLALFLFAISVNFVSDGLRDALDPRLRR